MALPRVCAVAPAPYRITVVLVVVVLGLSVLLVHQVEAATELTAKEVQAVEKLRVLMTNDLYRDYMKTDAYLLRWLKYFDYDVERTANLIKTANKWRKDNKIDSLLNEDISALEKMFPYDMEGVDKEGRPVWINYFGKWDVRKMAIGGQINEYNKFLNFQFEKIEQKVRDLDAQNPDKNITQFILLVDMQGYNLRQQGCLLCIPGTVHFVNVYERYHAGGCFKPILVNTPTVFESLLDILRPIMSARTREDLAVYGFDQQEWQPVLNNLISPDQLPTKLAGNRKTKVPV